MACSQHRRTFREICHGERIGTCFERYTETMIQALGHADRATPARWYLRGLMLPGSRKSVELVAARVHPQDVRSAHQSMYHLVADSDWSHSALLAAVTREVVPALTASQRQRGYWMIDDTGHRKYGRHSGEWRGNTAGSWARSTTVRWR